ncbi:hypothetical protein M0804_008158 [Polistes exclamans]|nr:hypothetical protein M0804_008158 [Polistes exclamans]
MQLEIKEFARIPAILSCSPLSASLYTLCAVVVFSSCFPPPLASSTSSQTASLPASLPASQATSPSPVLSVLP